MLSVAFAHTWRAARYLEACRLIIGAWRACSPKRPLPCSCACSSVAALPVGNDQSAAAFTVTRLHTHSGETTEVWFRIASLRISVVLIAPWALPLLPLLWKKKEAGP